MRGIQPARPYPSRITKQRTPAGQKYRRIEGRRMKHYRLGRRYLLDQPGCGDSVVSELPHFHGPGDDPQEVERACKYKSCEQSRRQPAQFRPLFKPMGQQISNQWNRADIPVEKDFDVVPYPGSKLHHIRNNVKQSERQIEDEQPLGQLVFLPSPENRSQQKRNKEAGVEKPEPEWIEAGPVPA